MQGANGDMEDNTERIVGAWAQGDARQVIGRRDNWSLRDAWGNTNRFAGTRVWGNAFAGTRGLGDAGGNAGECTKRIEGTRARGDAG
jgi:hypothetical protein